MLLQLFPEQDASALATGNISEIRTPDADRNVFTMRTVQPQRLASETNVLTLVWGSVERTPNAELLTTTQSVHVSGTILETPSLDAIPVSSKFQFFIHSSFQPILFQMT